MDDGTGQDIADALGLLLRRTTRTRLHRALTDGMGEAVDELTYPVLSALARTGPCSAAQLAADAGIDRSGVTRRASRLEDAGLVRREPDPSDRRAALLVLTDAGERTVARLRRRLAALIGDSLASWPPGEAEIFARGLRRFAEEGPFDHGAGPAVDR
ncbi:MarR family winged helix-turn-helix transcriptional regulator [Streptomyces fuscigenes]|uniref:MarR family winged helix-turn-helix transcriptional regulator n=1 Tax=Streptomyces fuscigenes TaxID=1528880 RepID=UPI001F3D7543|nr:MarR family transcriptional regulator [Streptomyces fuscigenes]MCF3962654.1 MarR family transcriptional regulator [Streptomyces fuscigenes]